MDSLQTDGWSVLLQTAFVKAVGDIALAEVDAGAVRRYIDGKG